MAQGIHRLTDKQIKNATKDLNDGGNLWILRKRETKVWAFRYQRMISLNCKYHVNKQPGTFGFLAHFYASHRLGGAG